MNVIWYNYRCVMCLCNVTLMYNISSLFYLFFPFSRYVSVWSAPNIFPLLPTWYTLCFVNHFIMMRWGEIERTKYTFPFSFLSLPLFERVGSRSNETDIRTGKKHTICYPSITNSCSWFQTNQTTSYIIYSFTAILDECLKTSNDPNITGIKLLLVKKGE